MSEKVVRDAVEAFNNRDADALGKLLGGDLAKNAAAGVKSAVSTLHVTDAKAEGDKVRFSYVAKGDGDDRPGSGVATVANGQIVGLEIGGAVTLTGNWSGSAQGITVTLQLVQTGTNVTGTANAFGSSFPVTGTVNYPNVNLAGNMNGVQVTFSGAYNPPPNTIPGTLTALGSSIQVTLRRQ